MAVSSLNKSVVCNDLRILNFFEISSPFIILFLPHLFLLSYKLFTLEQPFPTSSAAPMRTKEPDLVLLRDTTTSSITTFT